MDHGMITQRTSFSKQHVLELFINFKDTFLPIETQLIGKAIDSNRKIMLFTGKLKTNDRGYLLLKVPLNNLEPGPYRLRLQLQPLSGSNSAIIRQEKIIHVY